MGKSHHSRAYNEISIYPNKLFAIFFLMCSLKSKNFSKDMNYKIMKCNKSNKEYCAIKEGLENKDNNNLDIPADKNSIEKNESYNKNLADNEPIEYCKTSVVSEILPLCENIPHNSDTVKVPVVIKIPVVLTECTAAIAIESFVKLEDNISEIKCIRKYVYLNQCKLAPNFENINANTSILFIDGFIKEDIEYTNKESYDKDILEGDLKHTEVQIPFKCATRVNFKTCPKFKSTIPQDEAEILNPDNRINDSCEKNKTAGNPEQSSRLSEFFNDKVFCELISAEIVESDILENRAGNDHNITEKATLFLTIELLQNQHLKIY